jgi:hypothetical protein
VRDRRRAVVDLQMNWPEVIMRVVLMPADEQTALWLDPVEAIVFVRFPSLQLKPDLDPRGRHRVLVVIKELAWVYPGDDPVWAGFTRFSTSSMNVLGHATESILDAFVESLALQVRPISEEDNH